MSPSGLTPTLDPAVDEQAPVSVLKTLLATAQHFCPCPRPLAGVGRCVGSFLHHFAGVSDPRQPELITYPLAALIFGGW